MPLLDASDQVQGAFAKGLSDNITGQCTKTLKGVEVCGTEKDLDENAYGAAAVALVREVTALSGQIRRKNVQSLTIVRLLSSTGLMAANLVLQFMLLNYIGSYVVEPAVRHVQTLYQDFHTEVFDADGHILADAWGDYAAKDRVCQITMADRWFYYIILFLWALRILDELRKIHRSLDDIWYCKSCASGEDMLEFTEDKSGDGAGVCLITHLTGFMRWMLVLLVILPRTFIALRLLVLGCRWLSASASFADMVLNALALVFVTDIDELLYNSILPAALKKQIADTNFFFVEEPQTKQHVDSKEWVHFRRTLCWLLATFLFLFVYGEYVQSVLPNDLNDLRLHCMEFVTSSQTPICTALSWGGKSEECYPYNKDFGHGLAAAHGLHHTIRHGAHGVAHGHGHPR